MTVGPRTPIVVRVRLPMVVGRRFPIVVPRVPKRCGTLLIPRAGWLALRRCAPLILPP